MSYPRCRLAQPYAFFVTAAESLHCQREEDMFARAFISSVSAWVVASTSAVSPAAAQITTGTIGGSVRDAQGAIVPGATVTLVNPVRNTTTETQTNSAGDFVFPNVTAGTYTVRVTMDGFKTSERPNVILSPGDRLLVPTLTIEVGTLTETVTVQAESPIIQASSGERSFAISKEAVENLPISNRGFAGLASLAPGVASCNNPARIGGGGQNNIMMDGISTMDTGNNGMLLQMNVESIAEVKVLTSSYQAEYGRSSGLQITAVTKSGTNRFHGSTYGVFRDSDWNSNLRTNVLNGDPKTALNEKDLGYSLGGPIGRPRQQQALFLLQPRVRAANRRQQLVIWQYGGMVKATFTLGTRTRDRFGNRGMCDRSRRRTLDRQPAGILGPSGPPAVLNLTADHPRRNTRAGRS